MSSPKNACVGGYLPGSAYNKPHPCCYFIPSNLSKVWGTKKPPSSFSVPTCNHYGEYLHGATSQWPIHIMKVASTKHRSQVQVTVLAINILR